MRVEIRCDRSLKNGFIARPAEPVDSRDHRARIRPQAAAYASNRLGLVAP